MDLPRPYFPDRWAAGLIAVVQATITVLSYLSQQAILRETASFRRDFYLAYSISAWPVVSELCGLATLLYIAFGIGRSLRWGFLLQALLSFGLILKFLVGVAISGGIPSGYSPGQRLSNAESWLAIETATAIFTYLSLRLFRFLGPRPMPTVSSVEFAPDRFAAIALAVGTVGLNFWSTWHAGHPLPVAYASTPILIQGALFLRTSLDVLFDLCLSFGLYRSRSWALVAAALKFAPEAYLLWKHPSLHHLLSYQGFALAVLVYAALRLLASLSTPRFDGPEFASG